MGKRHQSFCSFRSSTDNLTRAKLPVLYMACRCHSEHTHSPSTLHPLCFEKCRGRSHSSCKNQLSHTQAVPGSQHVGLAQVSKGVLYFPHLRSAGLQHRHIGARGLPPNFQAPMCVPVDHGSSLEGRRDRAKVLKFLLKPIASFLHGGLTNIQTETLWA